MTEKIVSFNFIPGSLHVKNIFGMHDKYFFAHEYCLESIILFIILYE